MVYIADITDDRALIHSGPVLGNHDRKILTSTNLEDVADFWEMQYLPNKEKEWPSLRLNALDAFSKLEDFVIPKKSSPLRLLDFGCGWGFDLLAAKEKGWELYGIEPLPACAVYARMRNDAIILTDTLRDDSYPPDFFDCITAFQVFEHLPDPDAELTRLYHMMVEGGVLLIEVPNIETWSVSVLRERHRHFVQDHINFFSKTTLGKLMQSVGFEVVEAYHPSRKMALSHLTETWGPRFLPQRLAGVFSSILSKVKLRDKIISLNFGDVIALIARKPV